MQPQPFFLLVGYSVWRCKEICSAHKDNILRGQTVWRVLLWLGFRPIRTAHDTSHHYAGPVHRLPDWELFGKLCHVRHLESSTWNLQWRYEVRRVVLSLNQWLYASGPAESEALIMKRVSCLPIGKALTTKFGRVIDSLTDYFLKWIRNPSQKE